MTDRTYPSNPAEAATHLFLSWFGTHYARSVTPDVAATGEAVLSGRAAVGRRWSVAFAVADTVSIEADVAWEASRAAVEQRLDAAGRPAILWVPPGAELPAAEPGLSDLAVAVEAAVPLSDGRLEARRPVSLHLRRTATSGSVISVLGGLGAHWAQFTNKVPGTFQLSSNALHRLPGDGEERDALFQRIVNAAAQPDIDEGQAIPAEDAWSVNPLDGGRCYVIGSPQPHTDEHSASLRRNLRTLLQEAAPVARANADGRALVVLGTAAYAEEEKLSWALKGMDPRLYAGFDLILVVTDGTVRTLLEPPRGSLPWDAPLG